MNRWGPTPDGILHGVETIKMIVLPQFLFLFQTLQCYHKCILRTVIKWFWTSFGTIKSLKDLKFKILSQQKEVGGFGVWRVFSYTTTHNNEADENGNRNQMD